MLIFHGFCNYNPKFSTLLKYLLFFFHDGCYYYWVLRLDTFNFIILQENIITESNNYIKPQESVIIITVTIIIIISLSCKYYRFRCSLRVVPSCGPFLHSSLSSLHPPSYNSSPRWLLSLLLSLFFIVILLVCKDKPCRFCCSLCLLSFLATVSARPSSPSSPSQL